MQNLLKIEQFSEIFKLLVYTELSQKISPFETLFHIND